MGVQSTIRITRLAAEAKWVDKKLESLREDFIRSAKNLPTSVLEDAIEEHFYNYTIDDEEEDLTV